MIEISKIKNEYDCFDILITDGMKNFRLNFGGNGDLHWMIDDLSKTCNDTVKFNITKENYMLYSCLLYTSPSPRD